MAAANAQVVIEYVWTMASALLGNNTIDLPTLLANVDQNQVESELRSMWGDQYETNASALGESINEFVCRRFGED